MKRIFIFLLVVFPVLMAHSETFSYRFNSTPLPEAIQKIMEEHPGIDINFIYNELENYRTSATVNAKTAYDALRQTVGLNPVTVTRVKNTFYLEALQHGKYLYSGKVVGMDDEPVAAATVMLLTPKDSTVITYGITDSAGRFSIPCDRKGVIGKLSSIGYKTKFLPFNRFAMGAIRMEEKTIDLRTVTVETDNAQLYSDKSVYMPTAPQKKASQSGLDLLAHMAIPQLAMRSDKNLETISGKPVAVFINYLPASESDLTAMRVADVKRVEFLEYPSDPRLQGHPYVINFIMQQYEYGGYAKAYTSGSLLNYQSEYGIANVKLQYRNMTYDLMGSAYNLTTRHAGGDMTETFRLPQEDGSVKEFDRISETLGSRQATQNYNLLFRAIYNSDKIQASSQISGNIAQTPNANQNGTVKYAMDVYPDMEYHSTSSVFAKFLSYNGYYFFSLPKNNSITLFPRYSFSHTDQNNDYQETGSLPIVNSASDNTNELSANLKFSHDFGKYGTLLGLVDGTYQYSRTSYSGTATAYDRAKTFRLALGMNYEVTVKNVRGQIGFGWDWDRFQFGSTVDRRNTPSCEVSLQFTPNRKHSFSASFEYKSWLPSPNFKSDQIVTASPFMKYTGNPNLFPSKSYDMDFSYAWIPNNNYSLSAYFNAWKVADRYVYDYEPYDQGILRTIKQPLGTYLQGSYGVKGTARFFDRSLVVTGSINQNFNHNGAPYNVNHSSFYYIIQSFYYLNNWHFGLSYFSPMGTWDGMMTGVWQLDKDYYYINVGWGYANWQLSATIRNIWRWNWRSSRYIMDSEFYSTDNTNINGYNHAGITLTATYVFGFGKKIQRNNEPRVSGSASSGILR